MAKLKSFKMPWYKHIEKKWADFRKKPWIWVDMGHLTVDSQGMLEIRYEYNDLMIEYLKNLNYNGDDNDHIVQKYIERCYLYIADDDPNRMFEGINLEDNEGFKND